MNRKFKVGDRVIVSFWGVESERNYTPSGLYFSKSMRDKVRGMETVITTVYNDDVCMPLIKQSTSLMIIA